MNTSLRRKFKKIIFNPLFCFIFSIFLYLFDTKHHRFDINGIDEVLREYPDNKQTCIRNKPINNHHKYNLQIIVPCYKTADYLVECIDSIITQSIHYRINIILIDDGSPDDCGEICDLYAKKDSRITVIHQSNKGFSGARNSGLDMLDSDYVLFLDSDDYLSERTVVNDLLDFAYSLNVKNKIIEFNFLYNYKGTIIKGEKHKTKTKIRRSNFNGYAGAKLFSSDLFINVHFPEGYLFEDTLIKTIIIPMVADNYFGFNKYGYVYRMHSGSISHSFFGDARAIDSIYITKQLLLDYETLQLRHDKNYEDMVLRQIVCNQSRIKGSGSVIMEYNFLESKTFVNKHFDSKKTSLKYKVLFWTLKRNKYRAFNRICSILIKTV